MAIIITAPGSDSVSGTNTIPQAVPQKWADDVLEAAKFARVIASRVSNWSGDIKQGDVLNKTMLSNLGETGIPTDASDLTFEAPQESAETLTVDQARYAAVMVASLAKVQSQLDLMRLYTNQLGYAHSRAVDYFLAGKFDLAGTSVGISGQELTYDDYVTVWTNFQTAGIVDGNDPGEVFSLIVCPETYAAALKTDAFTNKLYNPQGNAVQRAELGDILGMRVFLSNLLEGSANAHDNAAFHRDAYALATQKSITVETDRLVQKLADIAVAWTVYGGADIDFPPEADPGSATYSSTDNRAQLLATV